MTRRAVVYSCPVDLQQQHFPILPRGAPLFKRQDTMLATPPIVGAPPLNSQDFLRECYGVIDRQDARAVVVYYNRTDRGGTDFQTQDRI